MEPDPQHPNPPPLPPSPLTEVVEVEPFERLRLPWTTLVLAALAGPVAAGLLVPVFVLVSPGAVMPAVGAATMIAVRGLLLAFGVVVADRLARSGPRVVRWAAGMGLVGLVPGLEVLVYALAPCGQPHAAWWIGWILAGAARDGALGAVVGWEVGIRKGALWRSALAGAAVWGAYPLLDIMLSGPLAELELPSLVDLGQVGTTLLLGGAFLGLALAFSLQEAWRKMEQELPQDE